MQRLRSALAGCLLAGSALFAAPRTGPRLTDRERDDCAPGYFIGMMFPPELPRSLGLTAKGWDRDAIAEWFTPLPAEEIVLPGPLPLVVRHPARAAQGRGRSTARRCYPRPGRRAAIATEVSKAERVRAGPSPTTSGVSARGGAEHRR